VWTFGRLNGLGRSDNRGCDLEKSPLPRINEQRLAAVPESAYWQNQQYPGSTGVSRLVEKRAARVRHRTYLVQRLTYLWRIRPLEVLRDS